MPVFGEKAKPGSSPRAKAYVVLAMLSLIAGPRASSLQAFEITNVVASSFSANAFTVSWTINAVSTPTIVLSSNNFATALSSASGSLGLNTTSFMSLSGNTTYWFKVKNSTMPDSDYTSFNASQSTPTLAAQPMGLGLGAVSATSLTLSWLGGGNGPGTLYTVLASTAASPSLPAGAVVTTTTTFSTSASTSGLAANTAYYFQAAATNDNGLITAYAAPVSTSTLAAVPTGLATSLFASSITLSWSANGNPGSTLYLAQISTDSAFGSSLSSVPISGGSYSFFGLGSNTTYFLRVQAVNGNNIPTSFITAAATATLVAAPTPLSPTNIGTSSVTVNWGANGNSTTTVYEVRLSTDNFATYNLAVTTVNAFTTFSGLAPGTNYYSRVRAYGGDGTITPFTSLPSAVTSGSQAPPAAAAPAFLSVSLSSVAVQWSANGNPAGTTYYVQIATVSNFATVNFTSQTYSTSAIFGLTGAGASLLPNTSYFFQAQSSGTGGLSAFLNLGSTSTLAAAPASAISTFSSVTAGLAGVTWSANGNPLGITAYTVALSTGSSYPNSFSGNVSLTTAPAGAPAASLAGLAPNTTYFLFAQASNNNGVPSGYAGLGSTATLAALPAPATSFTLAGATSLGVAWLPGGNPLGVTTYTVVLSTGSSYPNAFTGNVALSTVPAGPSLAATVAGLGVNATYFLFVDARNWANTSSGYAGLGSTSTLANPPSSAASTFTAISTGALSVAWSANGNPGGTNYVAVLSTASPLVTTNSGNISQAGTATSANFAGPLASHTTYFLFVQALNNAGTPSVFAALGSTSTLAAAPGTIGLTSVGASTISINWGAGGNSTTTLYNAQVSTDNFATMNASLQAVSTGAAFTGLAANTAYYFRAQAQNNDGTYTAFDPTVSTTTLIAVPSSALPAFSGVTSGSITAAWGTGGNSAQTTYIAQMSTDNFATVNVSSATQNLSAIFGAALSPNTTYFFQVKTATGALSSAFLSLGSTYTLAAAPGSAASTFSVVGGSSMTVVWSGNGNPLGPTVYTVVLTTGGAFPNSFSGNVSLTTAPAGSPAATLLGLSTTTLYYLFVNAVNGSGIPTAYTALGSTATSGATLSAAAFSGVGQSTLAANWNSNFSSGTIYYAQLSTGPFQNSFAGNVTSATANLFAAFTSLTLNTSYYAQVSTNLAGPFTALGFVLTLPAYSTAPGAPAVAGLGVSSISWTWSTVGGAASYNLYQASNLAFLGGAAAPPFNQTGLSANTAYGLLVAGVNASGQGALSASATSFTLAAPPSSTTVAAVNPTSATLSWQLNSNPPGTSAEVQRSVDGVSFASVVSLPTTGFTDSNLQSCTSYYYRVRNKNGNAIPSPFDAAVPVFTPGLVPQAPIGLSADAIAGNQVSLSWTGSPSTSVVNGYRLYYDAGAGAVNFASPLMVFSSSETSWLSGVLPSSAAYAFVLRAKTGCGIEETTGVRASAASVPALVLVRAGVKAPASGKRVKGNRVSVVAELTGGAIAQASSVVLQFRPTGGSAWSNIVAANAAHPNPPMGSPFLTQWDTTLLSTGSYDLRAVAFDLSGSSDSAPAVVTLSVASPADSNYDINENVDPATGRTQSQQILNTAVVNTVQLGGASASDPVAKIVLSSGIFSASTVTLTAVCNPVITTPTPSGFLAVGSAVQISLSNGQTQLNGSAALTLSYPSGVGDPSQLRIVSLNEATGVWSQDIAATVNTASLTITGVTPHFSIFAIVIGIGVVAMPDLSTLRVYPVPWVPNGGNPDQGKAFSIGDPTSGIIFDNLPVAVTIKIYTLKGRMVANFTTVAGTGAVRWDGTNMDGLDAAVGGYFAVISAPGLKSVVKKLAIIR